jgi:hypothetical protein
MGFMIGCIQAAEFMLVACIKSIDGHDEWGWLHDTDEKHLVQTGHVLAGNGLVAQLEYNAFIRLG